MPAVFPIQRSSVTLTTRVSGNGSLTARLPHKDIILPTGQCGRRPSSGPRLCHNGTGVGRVWEQGKWAVVGGGGEEGK